MWTQKECSRGRWTQKKKRSNSGWGMHPLQWMMGIHWQREFDCSRRRRWTLGKTLRWVSQFRLKPQTE